MSNLSTFRAVRIVGTVLPREAVPRASELRMPGQKEIDYDLPPGMPLNAAIARAWEAMLATHQEWRKALGRLPKSDVATKLTRDKWLLPLMYELGWGRPEAVGGGLPVAPGLGETEPPHFPISHRIAWPDSANPHAWAPLHLLGSGVGLDIKTPSVTARAPQSMLQDYLNREDKALWGLLSNGHHLRLLRDASTLARQSFVEFDLDLIFENQLYADFRLLFLTVHASRFAPRPDANVTATKSESDGEDGDGEEEPPTPKLANSWLEQWRTTAIDDGARALLTLRDGVAAALQELGTGFLSHSANAELRETLATAPDADRDLQRALLRIAYRLIVLFVAEDRDLLHSSSATGEARDLYAAHFSTARLRGMAMRGQVGGWHTDLWDAHQIVTDALSGDGLETLGLSGLGATLFDRDALSILEGARLPNRSFLAAVRALAQIDDPVTGLPRQVDYRNLDSEELGGMYEGLLTYTPRYSADDRTFTLEVATGNDRKKSGSYYTPSDLIELVLAETLDPLIDEALKADSPEPALLSLTVVDPACGSGHFVVAAARRIAAALAMARTGDSEPSPAALRIATADVVEHCVYGVDINDLAIEITKVALWLEAFDADRPFPFLDAHFRVGNALLGTTPALLRDNVPDAAFVALGDDDKDWTSKLKARNKSERTASADQLTIDFGDDFLNVETTQFTKAAHDADTGTAGTVTEMRARADAWRKLETDPELLAAKLVADGWCAAFVQPKTKSSGQGVTHATLHNLSENPSSIPDTVVSLINDLARQYRFFHWHLEFPGIFTVPADGNADSDAGWTGGFSCVVGNPPWDALQLEDKQFFGSLGYVEIEKAPNADARKKMIKGLASSDPDLYQQYASARRLSDATNHLVRGGRYRLTAQGKVNTSSVFAEAMRTIVSPYGNAGVITPTGIATGNSTAAFISDTLETERLRAFYDFENEAKIFADVTNRVRFAVTVMTGSATKVERTRFAFVVRNIADVPLQRFDLAAGEVLMMNPNTGNLPMFHKRIDADICLSIYRRFSVLILDGTEGGNPWGLTFSQGLFNMATDSGLFQNSDALRNADFNGWSYWEDKKEYVPLYEGKMVSHFDHRFATYRNATQAQINKGTLPQVSEQQHDSAEDTEPLPRYWVEVGKVAESLHGKWESNWLLGWRDITHARTERTFVPSVFPQSAAGHTVLLAFPKAAKHGYLLHALWSSVVFDYVARQKLSGTHMTYFIVKQIACPKPADFDDAAPWQPATSIGEWLRPYVIELSYTSWRVKPYAEHLGDTGSPFRWHSERRALLRAELDAAFLHVYKLDREAAEHILSPPPETPH